MEVRFTPEQEAQLSQIATRCGTEAEQLVKDAALRLLQDEAHFCEGVKRGIAAAERGEFVDHEEVWANVEKILQS
jgi:predicted transcriptional regulator